MKYLVTSLILAAGLLVTSHAKAQDDPGQEDTISTLLGIVEGVIDEKCSCPNSSDELAGYKRCLNKQAKKANTAFKTAIRYSGESFSTFKSTLNDDLSTIYDECESSLSDDSDPSDTPSDDAGAGGDDQGPGSGGDNGPPPPF